MNGPAQQKICRWCKQDCSQRSRTKDPRGRYFCTECYEKAVAKKRMLRGIPAPAPFVDQPSPPSAHVINGQAAADINPSLLPGASDASARRPSFDSLPTLAISSDDTAADDDGVLPMIESLAPPTTPIAPPLVSKPEPEPADVDDDAPALAAFLDSMIEKDEESADHRLVEAIVEPPPPIIAPPRRMRAASTFELEPELFVDQPEIAPEPPSEPEPESPPQPVAFVSLPAESPALVVSIDDQELIEESLAPPPALAAPVSEPPLIAADVEIDASDFPIIDVELSSLQPIASSPSSAPPDIDFNLHDVIASDESIAPPISQPEPAAIHAAIQAAPPLPVAPIQPLAVPVHRTPQAMLLEDGPPAAAFSGCPHCHHPMATGAIVCLSCGFNLMTGTIAAADIQRVIKRRPPRSGWTGPLLLGTALAAAAIVGGILLYGRELGFVVFALAFLIALPSWFLWSLIDARNTEGAQLKIWIVPGYIFAYVLGESRSRYLRAVTAGVVAIIVMFAVHGYEWRRQAQERERASHRAVQP